MTVRTDGSDSFDSDVLDRAKTLAGQYTIVLQPHERLGFVGHSLELPTVFVDAPTANKCMEKMREALAVTVAVMIEAGQSPPAPADEHRRDSQVNIRLTGEERMMLEHAAKQRGFRGISDFMRSAAMTHLRRTA